MPLKGTLNVFLLNACSLKVLLQESNIFLFSFESFVRVKQDAKVGGWGKAKRTPIPIRDRVS